MQHGEVILNNISAEERLMQNIPRDAQKLVVHHPAAIDPSEVWVGHGFRARRCKGARGQGGSHS